MDAFESGPGRKWLFFVAGAAVWGYLLLLGFRGGDAAPVQAARLLAAGAFGLTAERAHRTGLTADADGLTLRRWGRATRYSWLDILDVDGGAAPELVLRTGARVRLLDNWHHDPAGVAHEVRRRLHDDGGGAPRPRG